MGSEKVRIAGADTVPIASEATSRVKAIVSARVPNRWWADGVRTADVMAIFGAVTRPILCPIRPQTGCDDSPRSYQQCDGRPGSFCPD